MANSYLDFDGRFVRLNDGVVELVRHFLSLAVGEFDTSPGMKNDMEAFLATWQYQGPGLYDIVFDRFVTDAPERRKYLADCLSAGKQLVSQIGAEIPLCYLQTAVQPSESVVYTGDFPTQLLLDAFEQLEQMVSGRSMTSAEWSLCRDPAPMIRALRVEHYQRELRLFAVACTRRVRHLLTEEEWAAVEASERFADGRCTMESLKAAVDSAAEVAKGEWTGGRSPDARTYARSAAIDASSPWPRTLENVLSSTTCAASAAGQAAAEAEEYQYDEVYESARREELAAQSALLRELVRFRDA